MIAAGGTETRGVRFPALAACALLAAGSVETGKVAVHKYFSIDELMHAHASWLTGRGSLPYRDFCDFHFPFLYQLLGVLWSGMDDDPRNVLFLRLAMLGLVFVIALAAAIVNRREGLVAALAAPAVLLTITPFVVRATEIRHDTLAFACFLAGLAVLSLDRPAPRVRGAIAGVLLALAVWSSQKAVLYGLPVGALLVAETARRRGGGRSAFGSAGAAWCGGGAVAFLAVLYLSLTGSWNAFLTFCFGWAFRWQAEYPGFSFRRALSPAEDGYVVACLLAAAGLAGSLAAWRRRGGAISDPAILLAACLASSLGYFVSLKAPYDYNLIPFLGFVAVFAGRGVGMLETAAGSAAARLGGSPAAARTASTLAVVVALLAPALALGRVDLFARQSNEFQLDVLAQVAALTSPADHAYDNSGSYVARPSASFYFYTDAPMRARLGAMLARRIPEDVVRSGTVLFLHDARTGNLPASLQAFLGEHFKPWSGDLWLWGQSYRADGAGRLASTFEAVRKDRYFVEPASVLNGATLTIDGRRVEGAVFDLEPGSHAILLEGPRAAEFHILWLPRDGRTWAPDFRSEPRFSRIL
jgi:hypothetical protein